MRIEGDCILAESELKIKHGITFGSLPLRCTVGVFSGLLVTSYEVYEKFSSIIYLAEM